MIHTIMKSRGAVSFNSLSSINQIKTQGALTAQNISMLNQASMPGHPTAEMSRTHTNTPVRSSAAAFAGAAAKPLPPLKRAVQKGQKVPLESAAPLSRIQACFGWNTTNPQCDVDVSAFLLNAQGRVPGDSWFVFYGQTQSPDKSCKLQNENGMTAERQKIQIDLTKLNANVKKIVFVLTINDAFAKKLHFGMMQDAYIRILNSDQTELASFQMTDYYTNVISMMIGEIYQHNGQWKFNAVGNGVAKDLAGLCALYGVQVND